MTYRYMGLSNFLIPENRWYTLLMDIAARWGPVPYIHVYTSIYTVDTVDTSHTVYTVYTQPLIYSIALVHLHYPQNHHWRRFGLVRAKPTVFAQFTLSKRRRNPHPYTTDSNVI